MTLLRPSCSLLLSFFLAAGAVAQESPSVEPAPAGAAPEAVDNGEEQPLSRMEQLRLEADSDGDGEISEEERAAMVEVFKRERQQRDLQRAERARGTGAGTAEVPREPLEDEDEDEPVLTARQKQMKLADSDGDGVISPDEREAFVQRMQATREAPAAARTDSRDEASQAESSAAEAKLSQREVLRQQADADGDGEISAEEREAMIELLNSRRQALSKSRQAKRREAQAGTPPEAIAVASEAEEPDQARELPKQFLHFDADGDGRLSKAERIAAREELKGSWSARQSSTGKQSGEARTTARSQNQADRGEPSRGGGRKEAVRQRLQAERQAEFGAEGGAAPSEKAPGSSAMQRRKEAVARERARRAAIQDRLGGGLAGASAGGRSGRRSSRTSLDSYRSLARVQPKVHKSKGKGWSGGNRQGVVRGKKRGSEYYRKQIQISGNGGGRGRGGRRNVLLY